jgi:hypothetical protein
MASLLDLLVQSQSGKEITANALFDACSPSSLFGRRAAVCSGLTWGYYGGVISIDGVLTAIANGTVTLSVNTLNYVEVTRAGVVSKNTTAFTPGSIPLYTVVTGASTATSYTDYRTWAKLQCVTGLKGIALSDANTTLTAAQARNEILEFTGTLTAQRNIVVPLAPQQWTIYNGATNGLQIIGATGTGVVIATTKTAIVYSNGTNVRRVTADV